MKRGGRGKKMPKNERKEVIALMREEEGWGERKERIDRQRERERERERKRERERERVKTLDR